jgi:cyclin-A
MLRASPFLSYTPSQISSAALALSYYTQGKSMWNKKMQETFGYELEDLKEIIINLNDLHFEAETLAQQAIQEKYKANKYLQVSFIKPKKITSDEFDEMVAKLNGGDELNTTADNIENVRQRTELLLN